MMATILHGPLSPVRPPQTLHHSPPFLSETRLPVIYTIRSQPRLFSRSLHIHHCLIQSDSVVVGGGGGTTTTISDGLFVLFRELGVDDREADALLQKHPSLSLAPAKSLRDRIVSLQSVGINGPALHSTVIKSPVILTAEETGPFLEFVREELKQLDPSKLEKFVAIVDPRTLSGFANRVRILLDHGVPAERLGHLINNVNIKKVFCDKTVEEIEGTILYLKGYNGLDWILRRPQLLNLDLKSQLIPRVEYLGELGGGDAEATATLIGKLPYMLAYSIEHYQGHLEFWRSVGLSDDEFFKVALVYPNVFSVSKERKLVPRIEFLQQCGLNSSDIFKFLIRAPLFLSLSFEANLSKKLALLVKIGYKHKTREMAAAMGWVTRTSCENMQMVIGMFLGYGFSCEDVLVMSKKQPQILQYNYQSSEKKVEYLIGEMGREIGELLAFPAFLGYKLDDRIKPRYEAKKESRGKRMSINKLLSVSAERFYLEEE